MDEFTEEDDLQAILSEQRRELLLAKTQDSDLEMAFNLQMEEALTASLALKPSSSSWQPPPLSPPYEPKDDLLDLAATLMLEDVDRFPQEYSDHECSVLEMKKVMMDLDCRIYDQKFASDVLNLPEQSWRKEGAYYERPYRADGASSSKDPVVSVVVRECVRLYSKGVVNEEMVKDVKVVVGGIGVAICDPRDNLIFEAKRKLVTVVDGETLSNEAAELEALVEGLNIAITLDLKAVEFFCDDSTMLYQYVTNSVIPGNSKIATLVNQISILQRNFDSCRPSNAARSDIKFAFKFARDAVVSQITWHAETSNGKSLKETCGICFEETDAARMFSLDSCLHRYCISCMKQHVEVKLLSGIVAHCPHEGCKSEVNIDSYDHFLEPKLVKIMNQRIKESSISVTERVFCPYPKCSEVMSKEEVLEYTKPSYSGAEESGARKCMKCHFYFCINCMVPWHFKMSCAEYKRSHPLPPKEDQSLKDLAKNKHWRQCVKCNSMVELAAGCYHITCRCKHEFCYTCGAEWNSKLKGPTCLCPIWDERNIINR